jgi:hypothetical protein
VLGFEFPERPLEPGDLRAQQAPALRRLVNGPGWRLGCHVEGGSDLAWVDPGRVRLARRVGRDRAYCGWPLPGGGDKRAAALLAVDQALVLEVLIDGADRVDVHADRVGHLA